MGEYKYSSMYKYSFTVCQGGWGVPPSLSWLEVFSFEEFTGGQTGQNRLKKGLSRKIVSTKDLAAVRDVKELLSCAARWFFYV
jgi:hypothetical protein